jgi:hypothetical protein
MKKLPLIKLFTFTLLIGFSGGIYSQPPSKEELQKEYAILKQQKENFRSQINVIVKKKEQATVSLEIRKNDLDEEIVIYTKPLRDLTAPEIQIIAKNANIDSQQTYHVRIELFAKSVTENSNKIFIKSSTETVKFDRIKDNSDKKTGIVKVCKNWGWCNQSGQSVEGYKYTYFIEMSKEDFYRIISSKDIKIRFFNIGIPDLSISYSNISKMNDLHTYLTSDQRIDMLNLQLREVLNKLSAIERLLNSA